MFVNFLLKKAFDKLNRDKPSKQSKKEKKVSFTLSESLSKNLENFKEKFDKADDVVFKEFYVGNGNLQKCCLVYIDGMADSTVLSESVIKPMLLGGGKYESEYYTDDFTVNNLLNSSKTEITDKSADLVSACLAGDAILLLDTCKTGIIISARGYETRSISEPQTELVVRGPREGFNESFRTNTSLLRRKIRDANLKMENLVIGEKTATDVCVVYIEGVARPSLVKLVKARLKKIDVDAILDAGYIEAFIEDSPLSIFPTVGYSEKPDVIAGRVLEGRVAILVDGSPFALTVPFLFIENFQTAEDYYLRPLFSSIIRLIRYMCYFIAIFALPIYISLTIFHQELVPTTLLFTFINAREGTPFPAIIEALVLVFSFEILREAGLRLPRPVGQAISIVGALIMGDAAVAAGLVGAPMVIVVAISAVAGFVTPQIIDTVSILRLIAMFMASILGGIGTAIVMLGVMIHLATLKSFNTPYFASIIFTHDLQDTFIRMPLWAQKMRPKNIAFNDTKKNVAFVPPIPDETPIRESEDSDD